MREALAKGIVDKLLMAGLLSKDEAGRAIAIVSREIDH